jgi:hypothetical protein
LGAAWFGRVSWHYTQHNNDFCTVCHAMGPAFNKFQATRHASIQCHDCHQQSILASMHELRIWVLDRPERIEGKRHTPNARCVACHVEGDPAKWKQIAATAGHRVHLESSRTELKDLQCVQCHGVTVHEFVPVRQTCGQAGCHKAEETRVALGRMANVDTDMHCTMCHDFLRQAPRNLSTDSAHARLTPGQNQCLACHPMEELAGDQFGGAEVHGAVCGSCHNPHSQLKASAAVQTCAGCHTRADTISPFHRGLGRGVLDGCTQCHQAHSWKVRGDDCAACHRPDQLDDRRRLPSSPHRAATPEAQPRIKVLNQASARMSVFPLWTVLRALLQQERPAPRPFLHRQHNRLQCTTCHGTSDTHGALKVRSAADCAACHHSKANRTTCRSCHDVSTLSRTRALPVRMNMSVWKASRDRPLNFAHERHPSLQCAICHDDPPRFARPATCTSCHAQHHDVARSCTSCHQRADTISAHDRRVHLTCEGSGCHSSVALPQPLTARSVCLACHPAQQEHQPGGDCASCHLVRPRMVQIDSRRRP